MPLKLVPPKEGRTPFWRVRGTYLRCYVHRTSGSPDKSVAQKLLRELKRQIEIGALSREQGTGFAAAAA